MRRLLSLLRSTATTSMTRVALALSAGLILAAPAAARAEPAPLIPRAVLFGNPEYLDPQISPDGTRLAYLRPDSNDVLQVWVRTLGQADDRVVTRDPERGIHAYGWAHTGRDLFYLQDTGGDENFHVLLTNLESGETRDLTPIPGVQANVLAIEPGHPDAMIVTMNRRDPALTEPWRIELASGALTLLAENPGDVRFWLIDHDLAVRGAIRGTAAGGGELCLRDGEDAPWRPILAWGLADEFHPLEFAADGRRLYASTSIGADTRGLQEVDLATGRLTMLACDPGSDLEEILFHPTTHEPQAVAFNRLRTEWRALDPSIAPDLAALSALQAGVLIGASRDLADRRWIAGLISDTGGLRYYAWERESGRAELLFDAMPALRDYALAPMKAFEIESRDGLSLPCYLTLPVGVPPERLPLVVNVHGGPWWRDFWGFNPEVQWLADRGYAVLQVNYRGSNGFGKAFLQAARRARTTRGSSRRRAMRSSRRCGPAASRSSTSSSPTRGMDSSGRRTGSPSAPRPRRSWRGIWAGGPSRAGGGAPAAGRALPHRRGGPRLRAGRRRAREHALDAQVLVEIRPVEALAGPDQAEVRPLGRSRVRQAPRPGERQADLAAIDEPNPDAASGEPGALDARGATRRSGHARPP